MGYQPMPWQVEAWAVAGELEGGRLAHPVVVWIVPRRAGKSLGVLATVMQRMATARLYRARYTAQTSQDAAKTFRDEWVPAIRMHGLDRLYRPRLSNGSEGLDLERAGSALRLFSPRETSLHGQPTDLGVVDEAWAFDTVAGDAIEAAIRPSMKTRRSPQLFIVSAAGTSASTWLARWRDLGRAGTPGLAYLEWSADPEHDDLDDPATLARVHPAVGHTIRADDVEADRATMSRAEYLRAYLGVWPDADTVAAVIPPDAWAACALDAAQAAALDLTRPTPDGLAVAVAPDGARTALAAAYRLEGGRTLVKVLDARPGASWAVHEARTWQRRTRTLVTADPIGPAGPLIDELRAAGVAVDLVTTDGYARACAGLLADVVEHRLAHLSQPVLDTAAASAGRRPIGDRWAWARRAGDVTAIEAASLAASAARQAKGKPFLITG
jgi:phage terminase large subunit-like protein